MRAIQMSVFGEADVLKCVDLPGPEPGPGEVRIRLQAAGIKPADTYIRSGSYAFFKPKLPWTPGFDGAGVVDAAGRGLGSNLVTVSSWLRCSRGGTPARMQRWWFATQRLFISFLNPCHPLRVPPLGYRV
jgi:NADPH2:quinone reductase